MPVHPVAFEPSGAQGFDFRRFWHSILEKIWIVVLCTLAGLFLSLGYLARTPKLYQSHIVLEVEMQDPTVVNPESGMNQQRSMFLASQEALRTIEQSLRNRTLLSRVVRAEGLAEDGGEALLGRSKDGKAAPKPSASPANADGSLEDALGGAIAGMVNPVIRRGTRLIDVYVTNQDPAMAQRLAEAVGREYIRNSVERRANFSQESLRYLLEEEERLKANLAKSEAAVADYKARTPDALQLGGGAAATGSQAGAGSGGGAMRGGLVEDKLQELSSKLTAAKAERLRLEGELKQVDQAGDNVDQLLAVGSIANSPAVLDRRREVSQIEGAVASLAQRYKDKHPRMMAARAALTEAQDALRRTLLAQPAVLRNAVEQARNAEASLEAATKGQEQAALALNKAAIGYQELARQAETDRALYESVLRQIKGLDLTKDVKTNPVSIVEHASRAGRPVSPQPTKSVAFGIIGGLLAGLGCIGAGNALDRSVKTVDDAEARFGLPVLAAVPEVKSGTDAAQEKKERAARGSAGYRLVVEAPEGPAAEAFRNLRAALALLGAEAERRVFLFSSALPSEGKSFTSANYALSLAQQGHRVLLIDGDLRRPSLHKIFRSTGGDAESDSETGEDKPGIVDYLVSAVQLSEAVRPVSASEVDVIGERNTDTTQVVTATGGQLSLLAGGRRAPNPAELLSGPSFARLISEAARLFDRVVIDSAPVLAVSDTLLMMPYVQSVCMVVRTRRTPRNAVARSLALLTSAGGRPVGLVLNRLASGRGLGYYYYYAAPGYGAGEGAYGSRTPQKGRGKRRSKNNGAS